MEHIAYSGMRGLPDSYKKLTEAQKTMGLELAGIGVISVDYVADDVVLDPVAAVLFGLPCDQRIARTEFHKRIHPDDWPQVEVQVNRLLDPAFEDVIELSHRTLSHDGKTCWVHTRKTIDRDLTSSDRKALVGTAAVRDITAEQEAKETNSLLVRELDHRTKNIVSLIAAVAQQTMRSGAPESFLDRFLPRLSNLADNAAILSGGQRSDLRETVLKALHRFSGLGEGEWQVGEASVSLSASALQAFSIIIHELATNAIKYGAMSKLGGVVAVEWVQDGPDKLVFTWKETGGPPVNPPGREGFGSRILTRYASMALLAVPTLAYEPSGFEYVLLVPAGQNGIAFTR